MNDARSEHFAMDPERWKNILRSKALRSARPAPFVPPGRCNAPHLPRVSHGGRCPPCALRGMPAFLRSMQEEAVKRLRASWKTLMLVSLVLCLAGAAWAKPIHIPRHPDYCNGKIAFSYLGDIWVATEDGSNPRRLNRALDLNRKVRIKFKHAFSMRPRQG